MMRIAISGGRGRLAPLIARHFGAQGSKVRLFSRTEGEGLESLDRLTQPETWEDLDVLIHCGWSSVPLTAERHPENSALQDLPLLRRILTAASTATTPSRIVFLSSAAIYGDTGVEPVDEEQAPQPLGAYARGKWEAEKILTESAIPSLILRVTNLLGEKPDLDRPQGILPRLIHAAKAEEEVALWGDGSATKDYLHCADLLSALQALLEQNHRGIYNVASGESVSLRDLIAMVEKLGAHRLRIRHEPHFSWDVSFSRVSNQKLKVGAGWSPRVNIEKAVKECFGRFS
jgi:UDP-glucose 4-epimerase